VITLELSTDQQAVVDEIQQWRDCGPCGDDQYLTLGGYAGTGKTTVIAHLAEVWPGVRVAAFCGKAAHVLRAKGVPATTIHALIYAPIKTAAGAVRFRPRRSLPGVETVIIDEASMVDHLLLGDLLSFGLPVLFVGDHGQLEPIGTNPGLMAHPHLRLERVHRQAAGNPILRLATAFREGRPTPHCWEDSQGRLRLAGRGEFDRLLADKVQILCGYNQTRHRVNARVRERQGYIGLVAAGEKLVCLRNHRGLGLFNGQQVTVLGVAHEGRTTLDLEVETDDGRSFTLPALRQQFGRDLLKDFRSKEVALLDYGYALTAHKAQGSEWEAVLALEQVHPSWDARRWRYTVATRAKERLVYCA
jgi:exodeoxyribonuclease-5